MSFFPWRFTIPVSEAQYVARKMLEPPHLREEDHWSRRHFNRCSSMHLDGFQTLDQTMQNQSRNPDKPSIPWVLLALKDLNRIRQCSGSKVVPIGPCLLSFACHGVMVASLWCPLKGLQKGAASASLERGRTGNDEMPAAHQGVQYKKRCERA